MRGVCSSVLSVQIDTDVMGRLRDLNPEAKQLLEQGVEIGNVLHDPV